MNVILTIAQGVYQKVIKSKILYVIVVFCLFAIAYSTLYSAVTAGEETKLMKDIGLAGIAVAAMLISIMVGSTAIPTEIESRTIQTLISKPVRKHEFILGQFLGAVYVALLSIAIMSVGFIIILAIKTHTLNLVMFKPLILICFEAIILVAVSVLFSTFCSSMVSSILAIVVYIAGHLSYQIPFLVEKAGNVVTKFAGLLLYYALPNFQYFNVKAPVAHGIYVPWGLIFGVILYGAIYTAIMLLVSLAIFKNKDFA